MFTQKFILFPVLPLLFFLERFSFYSFRLLLLLYWNSPQAKILGFSPSLALLLHGSYFSLLHFLPIVGGYLSDKVLGIKAALLIGLFSLFIGYSSFWSLLNQPKYSILALLLIAVGYGLCKPTLGSIIGIIYPKRSNKQESLFTWLYITLNLSIVAAALLGGYYQLQSIPEEMFFIAQAAIAITLILFLLSLPHLKQYFNAHQTRRKKELAELQLHMTEAHLLPREKAKLVSLGFIFLLALLFSAIHHQGGSLLLLYMGEKVDLHLLGYQIPTLWMTALGGLMTALSAGIFNRLWQRLSSKGVDLSPHKRLSYGLSALSLSFIILSFIATVSDTCDLGVNFLWILLFEFFFVIANGIVNPLLWSLTSAGAPERYRSFYMGGLIGITSLGGLLGSLLNYFLPQLGYHGIWLITTFSSIILLFTFTIKRWQAHINFSTTPLQK
jgi:POT family proton-dependent oligopeptide transporter